jgi:hypothetical protein
VVANSPKIISTKAYVLVFRLLVLTFAGTEKAYDHIVTIYMKSFKQSRCT